MTSAIPVQYSVLTEPTNQLRAVSKTFFLFLSFWRALYYIGKRSFVPPTLKDKDKWLVLLLWTFSCNDMDSSADNLLCWYPCLVQVGMSTGWKDCGNIANMSQSIISWQNCPVCFYKIDSLHFTDKQLPFWLLVRSPQFVKMSDTAMDSSPHQGKDYSVLSNQTT